MLQTQVVHGAPSVHISSDAVDAWITLAGAHVAPVTFHRGDRRWQPYSLAPWQPGEHAGIDPLLQVLRGDFWCLPFGEQPNGPAHGLVSCDTWAVSDLSPSTATLTMHAGDIDATVTKTVALRDDDAAVYQQFDIAGLEGDFPYGTHPILDFSTAEPGSARLSTSPLRWASVAPYVFSDPARGERQVLAPGGTFEDLAAVPTIDGGTLDLSRYPTPPGHEDLLMVVADPTAGPIAWSAASVGGNVWFSLRSVADFPATVFWVSNGGRPEPPWYSSHLGRIGIEDVCSYFHAGLLASREDRLASLGIPTTRRFHREQTTTLRMVQAVAFAEPGFGRVVDISMDEPGQVTLVDDADRVATANVDWSYVLV